MTYSTLSWIRYIPQARRQLNALLPKPPLPFKVIQEMPLPPLSPDYTVGFHGTRLSRVAAQIEKGKLENRQMAFFIAPAPTIAALYAKRITPQGELDKPVILEVRYNSQKEMESWLFRTHFIVPGDGDHSSYIHRVWEENPAYAQAMSTPNRYLYYPTFFGRFTAITCLAKQMHQKSSYGPMQSREGH